MSGRLPGAEAAVAATPAAPILVGVVARWRRRRALLAAAAWLAAGLGGAAVAAAAALACDLAGDPLPWLRRSLAWMVPAAAAAAALAAGWRLCRQGGLAAAAADLERRAQLPHQALSLGLALAAGAPAGTSAWMASRAVALAARRAVELDLARLAPAGRRLAGLGVAAAVLTALALGAAGAAPEAWLRVQQPWRDLAVADGLDLAPGDTWHAPGGSLDVVLRDQPDGWRLEMRWPDGGSEVVPLVREGAVQTARAGPLHRDLRWRLRGARSATAWRTAHVVEPPQVASIVLRALSPAGEAIEAVGGDAALPSGSQVAIEVSLAGARAAAVTLVGGGADRPLALAEDGDDGQLASTTLRLDRDLRWRMRLVLPGGGGGVVVEPARSWLLRAVPEPPPAIAAEAETAFIAATASLALRIEAGDGRRLDRVWLDLAGPDLDMRLELPLEAAPRFAQRVALTPAAAGLLPGDRLVLTAGAAGQGGSAAAPPLGVEVAGEERILAHAVAERLGRLRAIAASAATTAAEAAWAWRAAGRSWRREDPAAAAAALRATAARARDLAEACWELFGLAAATEAIAGAQADLAALRAAAWRGGQHAAALSGAAAAAEAGIEASLAVAAAASATLAAELQRLAGLADLAAAAARLRAAAADADESLGQLAAAASVPALPGGSAPAGPGRRALAAARQRIDLATARLLAAAAAPGPEVMAMLPAEARGEAAALMTRLSRARGRIETAGDDRRRPALTVGACLRDLAEAMTAVFAEAAAVRAGGGEDPDDPAAAVRPGPAGVPRTPPALVAARTLAAEQLRADAPHADGLDPDLAAALAVAGSGVRHAVAQALAPDPGPSAPSAGAARVDAQLDGRIVAALRRRVRESLPACLAALASSEEGVRLARLLQRAADEASAADAAAELARSLLRDGKGPAGALADALAIAGVLELRVPEPRLPALAVLGAAPPAQLRPPAALRRPAGIDLAIFPLEERAAIRRYLDGLGGGP